MKKIVPLVRNPVIVASAFLSAMLPLAGAGAEVGRPAEFAMCAVCHKTTAAPSTGLGPNLWNINGRKAGSLPGFVYSPAMKSIGWRWDRAKLTAFIADPRATVPGNRMAYSGLKNPQATAAIVDYLVTLK